MQTSRTVLACMRACGRKPCSAKPSGKLKSKHIKAPPPGGFLISICFRDSPARAAGSVSQDLSTRASRSRTYVPGPTRRRMTRILSGRGPTMATKPQYSTSFAARRPSAPRLADRLPDAAILLHGPGLPDDLECERQEPEFQHLLGLAALALRRVAKMVQPFPIQHNVRIEVRTADRRIVLEEFFGAVAQSPVVLAVHKVARL